MTLNGAARTYAGLPLAHSKLAVRTAVGCDGNGEQTIGKHADACIESLCLPACRRWRAALRGGCFTGFIPLSLGAVRAGKGGTRVVHDGGVNGIVFDAARLSTGRVDGAVWCSRG